MDFMWGKTVIVAVDGVFKIGIVRKVYEVNNEKTYEVDLGDKTITVNEEDEDFLMEPVNTYDTVSLDFLSGDVVAVGSYDEDGELDEVTLRGQDEKDFIGGAYEDTEPYSLDELDNIGYSFDKTNNKKEIDRAIDEMLDKLGDLMYTEEVVGACEYTRSSKDEIKDELEGIVEFMQ